MSAEPTPGFGPSRRQAARLAAVQALYQWQEGQHGPAEIIEQFLKVRTGEAGEGGMRRDADRPLFKDVVEGTVAHKEELEQTVTGALAEDWTWARVDRLVRAILLAGAYELIHRKDVPPGWRSTNMSRSPTPSTTRASRTSSIRCSIAWRASHVPPSSRDSACAAGASASSS